MAKKLEQLDVADILSDGHPVLGTFLCVTGESRMLPSVCRNKTFIAEGILSSFVRTSISNSPGNDRFLHVAMNTSLSVGVHALKEIYRVTES